MSMQIPDIPILSEAYHATLKNDDQHECGLRPDIEEKDDDDSQDDEQSKTLKGLINRFKNIINKQQFDKPNPKKNSSKKDKLMSSFMNPSDAGS